MADMQAQTTNPNIVNQEVPTHMTVWDLAANPPLKLTVTRDVGESLLVVKDRFTTTEPQAEPEQSSEVVPGAVAGDASANQQVAGFAPAQPPALVTQVPATSAPVQGDVVDGQVNREVNVDGAPVGAPQQPNES